MKKIRLVYPQWQGADISRWIPNIPAEDSSRGYYLGAMLLNFLAPEPDCEVYTVPISQEYKREVTDDIYDKEIIIKQTKAALDILDIANPGKVVTLGGECSVRVPSKPFQRMRRKIKQMSKKQLGRAERNRRIVNMYREGFSIDDIIAQSGFKSRSSVFRILNESGVELNRGRTKGPLGPRKKKETQEEEILWVLHSV